MIFNYSLEIGGSIRYTYTCTGRDEWIPHPLIGYRSHYAIQLDNFINDSYDINGSTHRNTRNVFYDITQYRPPRGRYTVFRVCLDEARELYDWLDANLTEGGYLKP